MANYQATSNTSLVFEMAQADKLIGKLSYKSWFKFNASLDLANNLHYDVEPKGFWGATIELKENEKVLLKFQMNWNGEIVIQSYAAAETGYILKHRGLFKDAFVLTDQHGVELLVMKPDLKWKKMIYEYQVTTADDFEMLPNKDLLLMTSLHCANYYISMISSMGV